MTDQKFYRITHADIDKVKAKGAFMKAGPRKSAPLRFSGAKRMWIGTGGNNPRPAQPDVIYVPQFRLAGDKNTVKSQLQFNAKELNLSDKDINKLIETAVSSKNHADPKMKDIVETLNEETKKSATTKAKNKHHDIPDIVGILKETQGVSADKKASQKKSKTVGTTQQRAAGSFYQKITAGGIYDVSAIDDKGGKARKLAALPNMSGRTTKKYLTEFNQVVSSDPAAYRRAMNLLAAEDKSGTSKYTSYADSFDKLFNKSSKDSKDSKDEGKSDDKSADKSDGKAESKSDGNLSAPARRPTLTSTSNASGPQRTKLNLSLRK